MRVPTTFGTSMAYALCTRIEVTSYRPAPSPTGRRSLLRRANTAQPETEKNDQTCASRYRPRVADPHALTNRTYMSATSGSCAVATGEGRWGGASGKPVGL